jgi:hypothetical protein
MTAPRSIERSVGRMYLASIVSVALAVVFVGGLMATVVVVERDDHSAWALAQFMGSELEGHKTDPPDALDELVRHELHEQRWFRRTIEVWRGSTRIGGTPDDSVLRPWLAEETCRTDRLEGVWARICTVAVDPRTKVVVGSPVQPLLEAELPLVASTLFVALAAILAFALISRRLVRKSLAPLDRFEEQLKVLPPAAGNRVPLEWGASEIDSLAETFNALFARIDDAIEREHQFVASAAHELRTPLTRLRGQIELVLSDAAKGSEAEHRLTLAVRTCEELARSYEALLALARDA